FHRPAALAAFEEVPEAVKLGVSQRLVLGEGSHGDVQTLSAIALRYYPSLPGAFSDWRAAPRQEPELRMTLANVHTPTMTLRNAALLALIGTVLMTALLVWTFVFNFLNLLRGLVP